MDQGAARRKAKELQERGKDVVASTVRGVERKLPTDAGGHIIGGWPSPKDEWEVFYLVPGTSNTYLPWFHVAVSEVVDIADHEGEDS